MKSVNTNAFRSEKSVVSEVQRLFDASGLRLVGPDGIAALGGRPDPHVRDVQPMDEQASISEAEPAPRSWAALLDLTHAVARHLQRIEAHDREQTRCVRQALGQARDGVVHAAEQAQRAEHLAAEAYRQAEGRIAAAEARVQAAEERARLADLRARHAEVWLARVQAAILSEFPEAADRAAA